MPSTTLTDISRTCIRLIMAEPFYGHFLLGMPKNVSSVVDTAAVGLYNDHMVQLLVNPDFWESQSERHREGVLKHELLHIVFRHLLVQEHFSNKKIFNIAADLVVNQYLHIDQLPEKAITLESFGSNQRVSQIELKPGMDVGYYYHQLQKMIQQNRKPTPQRESDKGPQHSLNDLLRQDHPELNKHKTWEKLSQLPTGAHQVLEHHFSNLTRQAARRLAHQKNFGNLPAGLVEQLQKSLLPKQGQLNWRRLLRLFAGSTNSTQLKNTIRRPSKRYGTTPGLKIRRNHRLLLALDTSGSIGLQEATEFFKEIQQIQKQGAEIMVVECDTVIQKKYIFRGQIPEAIHGRGGTSFNPPMNLAAKDPSIDGLIYFTDGKGPAPAIACRKSVLWVISKQGIDPGGRQWKELPGKKIKMK